jgi:segregation and condensation protein A
VNHPEQLLQPVAQLFGEPLRELPEDLYIPPDALQVFLEAFEGPLDLLLYLIRRQNLNVLDIPMARITAQYMEYIELMRSNRLELAAEYLLMAAVLIEIKSRMLLPPPEEVYDDFDGYDPRAELVQRLLEYEQIKLAAAQLDQLPQAERDFCWASAQAEGKTELPLPQIELELIREAWLAIFARAKANMHHRVTREELSVREHMSRILRLLADGRFVEFRQLFPDSSVRAVLVVNFLAVLELVKESLLTVSQLQPFDPIYIRLSDVPESSRAEASH